MHLRKILPLPDKGESVTGAPWRYDTNSVGRFPSGAHPLGAIPCQ